MKLNITAFRKDDKIIIDTPNDQPEHGEYDQYAELHTPHLKIYAYLRGMQYSPQYIEAMVNLVIHDPMILEMLDEHVMVIEVQELERFIAEMLEEDAR